MRFVDEQFPVYVLHGPNAELYSENSTYAPADRYARVAVFLAVGGRDCLCCIG